MSLYKALPGYFRPADKQLESIWLEAEFCFDANVLLNFYRYSEQTRATLLGAIEAVSPRVWVPHQAALEFARNRRKVVRDQIKAYSSIDDALTKILGQIEGSLAELRRHAVLDVPELEGRITKVVREAKALVTEAKLKHPRPPADADDEILQNMERIFAGRVGEPYTDADLKKIIDTAKQRYQSKTPPGYEDDGAKTGTRPYGDYVFWRQVIDHAKSAKVDIIVVTDEKKEDWWDKVHGETVGPRPEMVQEFVEETGQQFWLYRMEQFMSRSGTAKETADAIKEVAKLREEQEQEQRRREAEAEASKRAAQSSVWADWPLIAAHAGANAERTRLLNVYKAALAQTAAVTPKSATVKARPAPGAIAAAVWLGAKKPKGS